MGGDFNEILSYEEKEGGADSERRAIEGFRDILYDCDLRDLGFEGQWYTWERGRTVASMVRERLNKFCGNGAWCSLFPNVVVENLVRIKSDHSPIIVRQKRPKKKRKRGKKSFKFETSWLLDGSCAATVESAWVDAVEPCEKDWRGRWVPFNVGVGTSFPILARR